MTEYQNEISRNMVCVCLTNGVEKWIEFERALSLIKWLQEQDGPQFIEYDGTVFNRSYIIGLCTRDDMEDKRLIKNGFYKCSFNYWHDNKENCGCLTDEEKEEEKRRYDEMCVRQTLKREEEDKERRLKREEAEKERQKNDPCYLFSDVK